MEQGWMELWDTGLSFGMLGIAVIYFYRKDIKKDEVIAVKDQTIAALNTELRAQQEKSFDKISTLVKDNHVVLNALSEAMRK